MAADVDALLHARATAQQPAQYLGPVSLASLIVTITTLAWIIYTDQREKTPDPRLPSWPATSAPPPP